MYSRKEIFVNLQCQHVSAEQSVSCLQAIEQDNLELEETGRNECEISR